MEIKLVILSLACLSCLVPPALGTSLVAAKAAAAAGAVKLGIGALAAKGLAVAAAKGLALKGAAVLGAKALAAKTLAAKAVAAKVAAAEVIEVPVPESIVVYRPPKLSNIVNRLSNLVSTAHTAAHNKAVAVGELLTSFLPSKTVVQPTFVEVPRIVEVPKYISPPVRDVVLEPVPCPPASVAVVGPTMNVVY